MCCEIRLYDEYCTTYRISVISIISGGAKNRKGTAPMPIPEVTYNLMQSFYFQP